MGEGGGDYLTHPRGAFSMLNARGAARDYHIRRLLIFRVASGIKSGGEANGKLVPRIGGVRRSVCASLRAVTRPTTYRQSEITRG